MKTCAACLTEKTTDNFFKKARCKDGLDPRCRDCWNAGKKLAKFPCGTCGEELPASKLTGGLCCRCVPERLCVRCDRVLPNEMFVADKYKASGYASGCVECRRKKFADWTASGGQKKYYHEKIAGNPEKLAAAASRVRKWRATEKGKATRKAWHSRQLEESPQYRLSVSLRDRLRKAVSLGRGFKRGSAVRDLGCSLEQLRDHLESLFSAGMTWDNYGSVWHVDHIYPMAKADIDDPVQLRAVCNWQNLRPMMAAENISKSDSVSPEAAELFARLCQEQT